MGGHNVQASSESKIPFYVELLLNCHITSGETIATLSHVHGYNPITNIAPHALAAISLYNQKTIIQGPLSGDFSLRLGLYHLKKWRILFG